MGLQGKAIPASGALQSFVTALQSSGFKGEVMLGHDVRSVFSTDNSVYELLPRAVVFPKEPDDLNMVMTVAKSCALPVAARGGGTGTNGQSLSDQIVVDCSKHLTAIESIDPVAHTAVVQPGVILNQLNQAAGEYGLFFGPTVSTAAQATLGGMVATDASGKGSRVFGKTSDNILKMDVVLSDGSNFAVSPLDDAALEEACRPETLQGSICQTVRDLCTLHRAEIDQRFPVMNRGLTGYNLQEALPSSGGMVLTKLLAGSEGTLALTKRVTLRLLPKKSMRALMVIAYSDAMDALADANRINDAEPTAVEFIDDKIIALAKEDDVWADISSVLDTAQGTVIYGLNFVEVQASNQEELHCKLDALRALAETNPPSVLSSTIVEDSRTIAQIWSLRSKCVGLLGRMAPTKQGTPFVEDAAVPVENLREFVTGFRDILDTHNLAYGMFGHADVGCVHVRPALNMRVPDDAQMIRRVSDEIEALARRCGGVIWGEHGKGFRGEYVPNVFGPKLYDAMCQIKAAFDPDNLLNPGKLAAPSVDQHLSKLDGVPFRGTLDAQIKPTDLEVFNHAVKCNGNGQCFNQSIDDTMCPSYKATNDRRFSPKGRAALFRTWLRLRNSDDTFALEQAADDLNFSLQYCLSCKACSTRCPVKVDIPEMKSRFYNEYFKGRSRPARHTLARHMESILTPLSKMPALANVGLKIASPVLRTLGLTNIPAFITPSRPSLKRNPNGKSVLLIHDTFNGNFDGAVLEDAHKVLCDLGYNVSILSGLKNGKAAAVLGYPKAFQETARTRFAQLSRIAEQYDAMVEVEPSVSAMRGDDYLKLGLSCPKLKSIDEFLAAELRDGSIATEDPNRSSVIPTFIAHCTERSADPTVQARWVQIFRAVGTELSVVETGCCGMAGFFGHEVQNQAISRTLYDRHWATHAMRETDVLLATGFSCRSQVKRFGGAKAQHPIQYLASLDLRPAVAPDDIFPPQKQST